MSSAARKARKKAAGRAQTSKVQRKWLILAGMLVPLSIIGLWMMLQPSNNAAFAISARTGSLVLEPLCGERLIWDFGAGRFLRRSALPGTAADGVDKLTLILAAGARARVLATERGTLSVAVEHAEEIAEACGKGADQAYSASVNDGDSEYDSIGLNYESARADDTNAIEQTLPLSGRVVLGQSVQLGAGWGMEGAALLESGTVTMRVVPWAGDERITLRTESLDEGGILDTSPCGKADAAQPAKDCHWRDAVPARGFLRAQRDGEIAVQLYTPGPVSVQAFAGREHLLEISAFTAAVHSTPIQALVSMLVTFAALWSGLKTILRDLGWFADRNVDAPATDEQEAQQSLQAGARQEQHKTAARTAPVRGKHGVLSVCLLAFAGSMVGGIASPARAEPVEIHQANHVGSGNSFRRGATCLVLTAHHVVPETGVPITVFDRSGAKAEGTRSYDNAAYDLALIALPDNPPVACTTPWPDAAWMAGASFTPKSEFYATINHADGRESIVRLTYAGGIKHLLTLAPADKFRIIASDSGALVELDGKAAGIVQTVDEGADRVDVMRFDTIDQLVGDRFRGSASGGVISYAGVTWQGRENPNWSTYVQAWLTEKAGRTVYAAKGTVPVPPGACELKVDVLSWDHVPVPNPQYDGAQQALKICNKKGWLYETMCTQAKTNAANTPRQIMSQKLALNVTVTPPGSPALTKLSSSTLVPPSGAQLSQAEIELSSLQTAAAPPIKELLDRGGCT